jgi:glycosyltransferase involved in cell wall biosynthesis
MEAKFNSSQDRHPKTADPASPWVLVAAGLHQKGGMDKANLALGQYLVDQGTPVHVVCHTVDADFASHSLVTVHLAPLPAGSFFLGGPILDFKGRRIARQVTRRWPNARVLVNGDNCLWPGINWVHYVHHAWTPNHQEGPLWFRTKQNLSYRLVRRRERLAARLGRIFITNSNRTSRDLIEHLQVEPERVHTVYLGAESEWRPITAAERAASRKALGIPDAHMVAVFVGALGFEHRKGFDVLFESWKTLCANPLWDVDLLVAGSGNALPMWRQKVAESGFGDRIRMVGFKAEVRNFLAVADLLVSPTRYESYGLNVQEAICCGVPAIVSERAGVAERYGPEFEPLLLADPQDREELVAKVRLWRSKAEVWRAGFQQFGESLRAYSWRDMASRIVSIASRAEGVEGAAVPWTSTESATRPSAVRGGADV